MKIEIKRFIRNKNFIFNFVVVIFCFLMGYILCKSIDKIENLSLSELLISEITVYSQLGFMIFPILIMLPFSNDFSKKYISFYKLLDRNAISYFWSKFFIINLSLTIPTVISVCFICGIYRDFSLLLPTIFYMECVLFWQIFISSAIVYIVQNMITSYIVNIALWVFTIFVSVAEPRLSLLAYFDASNLAYKNISKLLSGAENVAFNYTTPTILIISIFIIVFFIVLLFRKRWEKNGIVS